MKIGVVGTAHWANSIHIPGLIGSEDAEFIGIWGRNTEKAVALARHFDTTSFASYADLLAAVDAVSFAVPPDVQAELAVEAARHGKHLILEKPIALSLDEGIKLANAVQEAGVKSVVFFTRLFYPPIFKAIQGARTERWKSAEVAYLGNAMRIDSPYRDSVWRKDPIAPLWDIGPHAFSVLNQVLGEPLEVRCAFDDRNYIRIEARHESGATSEISLTLTALPSEVTEETTFTNDGTVIKLPSIDISNGGAAEAFAGAIKQIAAPGHVTPFCDVNFGLGILQTLHDCERSMLLESAVTIGGARDWT